MLEVKDLSFSYEMIRALRKICLKFEDRKITGIFGPNGAGKSTLLYNLAGVLRPSEGKIYLNREDITHYPAHKRIEEGISLVPEGRRLFLNLTVKENLESGAYKKNARVKMKDTLERIYQLFPILKGYENQQARTLSGGEQQILAIARGLMSKPSILLLDEPLLGLSPKLVSQILNLLKKVNEEGVTIVISEQNIRKTLQISDYGYVLENGQVTIQGSSEDLIQNELIKKAYLGL